MVKLQSIIVLMLMGAVALATDWQKTEDLASSPIWQANHNVAQIFHADIQRLCSKPNEGEIPAELFWLTTLQHQNNNCSIIVPPSLFFGLSTLEEIHAIMNSMINIQEGIDMITTPGDSSSSSMTIPVNAKDDLESPWLVEGPLNQHQFPYHLSADAGAGKAPLLSCILICHDSCNDISSLQQGATTMATTAKSHYE
jgi:hypothetical protein